jgi:hypothetical protein
VPEARAKQLRTSASCFRLAVGDFKDGSALQTLIESWNGSVWSIASSPDSGAGDNTLDAVSCSSSIYGTAVGYTTDGSTNSRHRKRNGNQQKEIQGPRMSLG